MPFFDPTPKTPRQPTPNWRQVFMLLLFGVLVAVGGCGGAALTFSASYGGNSKLAVFVWWALMAVFCIGLLMMLAGVLFALFIGARAVVRAGQKPQGGP